MRPHTTPTPPSLAVHAAPAGASRRPRAALTAALSLLLLLCLSAPALALSQRGHAFTGSFGSSGEPGTTLSDPGAVAVSRSSGDVYVLDRGNARIAEYSPTGSFLAAWGWGVASGSSGKAYEVCEPAKGCTAKAGVPGRGKYQFNGYAIGLAVDNCTNAGGEPCTKTEDPSVGDVYVLAEALVEQKEKELVEEETRIGGHFDSEYAAVEKFTPAGEPIERITEVKYGPPGVKKSELEEEEIETEEAHGLTVGPEGTPWLYYEEQLYPLSDVALKDAAGLPLQAETEGSSQAGIALDAHGDFYLGREGFAATGTPPDVITKQIPITGEPDRLEEAIAALDGENTTGLAADDSSVETDFSKGDVYLDNGSSIAAFDQQGTLVQRFAGEAEGEGALHEGAGVAVNPATDTLYLADAATGRIDLYGPREHAPPSIDRIGVREVTFESAHLEAQIDTDGAAGTYEFQYGTEPCSSAPSACTQVTGSPASLSAAYGDQAVQAELRAHTPAPLAPASTYHFRVLANTAAGSVQSAEHTFTTPPPSGQYTADARDFQLVSPPEKDGADVYPVGRTSAAVIQAASDGSAITYVASGPFAQPEGSRSLEVTQILSTRTPAGGWSSKDIVTPNSAAMGLNLGAEQEYEAFTPNLSLALLMPFTLGGPLAEPPLSPPLTAAERGHQEKTIYLRDDEPLKPQGEADTRLYEQAQQNALAMGNPGYLPLVTAANVPEGTQFGGGRILRFAAATPDLSHAIVESEVPLAARRRRQRPVRVERRHPGAGQPAPRRIARADRPARRRRTAERAQPQPRDLRRRLARLLHLPLAPVHARHGPLRNDPARQRAARRVRGRPRRSGLPDRRRGRLPGPLHRRTAAHAGLRRLTRKARPVRLPADQRPPRTVRRDTHRPDP